MYLVNLRIAIFDFLFLVEHVPFGWSPPSFQNIWRYLTLEIIVYALFK